MELLFLSYIPRSGSTFLLNHLYEYDHFNICPEGEVLVTKLLFQPEKKCNLDLKLLFEKNKKLRQWNINSSDLAFPDAFSGAEVFIHILKLYQKQNQAQGEIIVFKAYELIHIVDWIPETFIKEYNIKFVFLIRDGRAAYYSQSNTIYRGKPIESNPIVAAKKWSQFVKRANKFAPMDNVCLLKYEKMIQSTEKTINVLFERFWPEIKFKRISNQTSFIENIPDNQKNMHDNVIKDPDVSIITKWLNVLSSEEVYIYEKFAGKQLHHHGYSLISTPIRLVLKISILVRYQLKRVFAIIKYWMKTT